MKSSTTALLLIALAVLPTVLRADEFFENRIRPVLVKHCYECHSAESKNIKGGLLLDSREATHRGGDSGAAVVPGNADESLLLSALRHDDFEMPPSGRLPENVIADFEKWILSGARDPRESQATAIETFDLAARVAEHWCWKPLAEVVVPIGVSPIDHFINRKLARQDLAAAPIADRRTLIRRLKFDLVGLPPSRTESDEFAGDQSTRTKEALVDRLIDSPQFGEKWASMWLDVMRYSETKGHVTDQPRPYVWKYRDYVIDAFNEDLPYDQFIIEHLAGDLLPEDRHRPGPGGLTNVAPTATGALFMHEMHFMSVDPVKQRWDEIDAQIDTVGKAFLGLTLGCARCHDHKIRRRQPVGLLFACRLLLQHRAGQDPDRAA